MNSLLKFVKKIQRSIYGFMCIISAKRLLRQNNKEEAVKELKKALKVFPNHFYLNSQLVKHEMEKENWVTSIKYWDKLFNKRKDEFNRNDYLDYSKVARLNEQSAKAINVLEEAHSKFPMDKMILMKLIELYKDSGFFDKAGALLKSVIEVYPKDQDAFDELINIIFIQKNWHAAIELLKGNDSFEKQVQLSMLYKIVGQADKANSLFDQVLKRYEENIKEDEKGYRKIIVFDNGDSRIEFYKCLKKTDSIMLTFDSINMEWHEPSFAFKLLMRQSVDILAVRKRKKQTYQQDLTQGNYVTVASPIVKGYRDKMAYGFSLGAYNALYFASLLDCRILALSPRLSIHPIYGRTKIIPKFKMKHDMSFPPNNRISPIIVYDPKNALDNRFINESVLKSFPKAKLVKIPYGGHGIAPHLLKMGLLKEFVIEFISGNVPKYDRKRKINSSIYYRNLGTECLKHNKLNWALQLAKKSLDMLPNDKNAIILMIKVLKELNKYEEAVEFAMESSKLVPNVLDIRLYLMDLYIHLGELDNAEEEAIAASKKFGNKKSIIKRKNAIKANRRVQDLNPETKKIS